MDRTHKNLLLAGMCGNLLCWVGDVLLSVFPGHETVSGLTLSPAWAAAPLWRFSLSAVLGGIAMMAVLCGFYAVYQMLKPDVPKAAGLFMLGGLLGCIPGAVMHMQCTATAWIYGRLGGTEEAGIVAMDFFTAHMPLLVLCTAGLLLACAVLFVCVARGKTCLPRRAAVFNILIIMTVLSLLKPLVVIPGAMNLGGAGMFLGLRCCLRPPISKGAET
ncbi:MAG: hypothetical protein Q4C45_01125 [Oscillospiraceae bacterium]|nr:hypothetical protein [Oscillospiraceae bacterium]